MTNMSQEFGALLKTDSKGRVRTPRQRREQLLDEFEKSGLSGVRFAQLAGLKYQTFAGWAARRRKQRALAGVPAKTSEPVQWLEAVVHRSEPSGGMSLKVHLPAGAWVEVSHPGDAALAAALLNALRQEPSSC